MLRALRRSVPLSMAAIAGVTVCSQGSETSYLSTTHMSASATMPAALSPHEWRSLKVTEKKKLTDNTVFVRFGFSDPEQVVGMHVSSCLITRAQIVKGKDDEPDGYVIRPYTPVSRPQVKGHLDLIVKVYPDGNMSKHIGELNVGDTLEFKGPISKLEYQPNMKKSIGMIAGGTGITPMLQVIEEILENPADKTQVSLVYANQTEGDIILKDKIDSLSKDSRFKVYYVVDKPGYMGLLWKGGVGYITAEMIEKQLPPPSDDSMIMVCGPPPMMKAISGDKAPDKSQGELTGVLAKMNYTKDNVFKL